MTNRSFPNDSKQDVTPINSYKLYRIQVVPGRAGGGSFKRKKNYIAKKEFAYRKCTRWPTIAMSKFFFGFQRSFCRCMAVMSCALGWCVCDLTCEVICGTTPVLLCTTKNYNVLLQYFSNVRLCTTQYYASTTLYYKVLQRTTPVLLCTTKYYSSTTLYHKVLRQYYSVPQSTTPVLLCTTKYYASTTLYYKVLLRYYSVLHSTTPVLLSTTKYHASTTLYYKVLLQYYKVLRQYYNVLPSTTTYYSSTTLYYKVLRQYYSVLRQYYNVLPNTTTYYCSTTLYYKVLRQYYNVLLQYYSVLQSTTPVLLCTTKYYASTSLYYKVPLQYYSVLRQYYNVLLLYYFATSFTMRGATRVTVQLHQILRLPRKMNVINDPHRIWNIISNARSNESHPPTSPNTAPATLNECHQWSASHMKRHFQCAEQVQSASNLTKCCACHAKWMSSMICVTYETSFPMRGASKVTLQPHQIVRLPRNSEVNMSTENPWIASANRKTIRGYPTIIRRYPRIKSSSRTRRFGDLPDPILETLFYCKIQHFALRLSPQMSQSAAPVTKSPTRTSPNTAPATLNECHQWSVSHMKRHFQCAEQVQSASNLTKCCACHAKWMSPVICDTYETSFPMHRASKVTLQPHQIMRLPRNSEVNMSTENPWIASANRKTIRGYPTTIRRYPRIKSSSRTRRFGDLPDPILETLFYCKIQHFALRLSPKMSQSAAPVTKSHPPTSPNTAPATQNELWTVTLLNCDCTELLLYWTVTLLNCYLTELLLCWTVTLRIYYFIELLLYWTITLLNCYLTELLLYWTVTWLNCDFTELWLYWTVTWLICYLTELLLYWTVTVLNCDCTELWLDWTVTLLNCDCTELLLDWSVTWLNCYFTNLLLYESITLRIYYFTNLLLYGSITLRNYYFTNLLLYESITLRIYDFTNLLLYESSTLRIYYFTDLFLYESMTLRIYDFTNLWLYESITSRIYYFTNRLLYESITLRIDYFTNLLLYESSTLRIYYFTNLLLYESMTLRIYYFTNLLLYESISFLICFFEHF